jgi:hypothetical protein
MTGNAVTPGRTASSTGHGLSDFLTERTRNLLRSIISSFLCQASPVDRTNGRVWRRSARRLEAAFEHRHPSTAQGHFRRRVDRVRRGLGLGGVDHYRYLQARRRYKTRGRNLCRLAAEVGQGLRCLDGTPSAVLAGTRCGRKAHRAGSIRVGSEPAARRCLHRRLGGHADPPRGQAGHKPLSARSRGIPTRPSPVAMTFPSHPAWLTRVE